MDQKWPKHINIFLFLGLIIGVSLYHLATMNVLRTCQSCTFAYEPRQMCCPCCESPNVIHFEAPEYIPKRVTSKLQCSTCSFENDLANQICVVCESILDGGKQQKNKNCEHCGHSVPMHIYAEHSTNCMLSKQLIEREKEEMEKLERMREEQKKNCMHCGLQIPSELFEEHTTNCLLSMELIEQEENERRQIEELNEKKLAEKQCRYCELFFPPELLNDHSNVCVKKPAPAKPAPVKPVVVRPTKLNIKPIQQPKEIFLDEPLIPASEYRQGEFLEKDQILRLTQLQYNAMNHMHKRANKQSNKARTEVQKRAKRLGYNAADLENLQFYIQNYAPVIVHIHIMRYMEFFIKDTHYRNQFQTGKSSGSLSRQSRTNWEDRMFDKTYEKAKDVERVKYGVINMTNDPKGVNCASGYGLSYMLLKDGVRGRCTVTDKDSSSSDARVGTFKYCLHILEKMNDRELTSAFKAAKAMQESSTVSSTYKEIQIHGPLQFGKDVQRLYVNKQEVKDKKFLDMVYEFSEKFGVDYEFF